MAPRPSVRPRAVARAAVLVLGLVVATVGVAAWRSDGRPSSPAAPEVARELPASSVPDAPTQVDVDRPKVAAEPEGPRLRQPVDAPSDASYVEPEIVLGTISIPAIGIDAPLGEGVALSTIDRGPSHWPGTALPGEIGNVVVAAHRVTHSRPFRNIDRLVPGDEVLFTVGGKVSRYLVTGSEVVAPEATEIVVQTPAAEGTLFACHPPGSARYRYVVHLALQGEPILPDLPAA